MKPTVKITGKEFWKISSKFVESLIHIFIEVNQPLFTQFNLFFFLRTYLWMQLKNVQKSTENEINRKIRWKKYEKHNWKRNGKQMTVSECRRLCFHMIRWTWTWTRSWWTEVASKYSNGKEYTDTHDKIYCVQSNENDFLSILIQFKEYFSSQWFRIHSIFRFYFFLLLCFVLRNDAYAFYSNSEVAPHISAAFSRFTSLTKHKHSIQ